MGQSLYSSIGIAITAHGVLLLAARWGIQAPRQVPAPPETPMAFAVEFLTDTAPEPEPVPIPSPKAVPIPIPIPIPKAVPIPVPIPKAVPTPTPKTIPIPKAVPTPKTIPIPKAVPVPKTDPALAARAVAAQKLGGSPLTTALAGPDDFLLAPDQSSPAEKPGGFSMAMRTGGVDLDARQGSLLDDAIAAAMPAPESGPRSDLIQLPERIGLDSATGSTTRWRHTGDGGLRSVGEPFAAKIASDGRIEFDDRDNIDARLVRWHGVPMPMIVGKFDLTDAAMAAFGEVLYPYRKLRAMDQTRDFRAAMAVRARGESLHSALNRFDKDLDKLWRKRSVGLQERRALLFALWDECAEDGPADVVKTATAIRALILRFIERRLPESSKRGYSAPELRALNAQRQSTRAFAPYP